MGKVKKPGAVTADRKHGSKGSSGAPSGTRNVTSPGLEPARGGGAKLRGPKVRAGKRAAASPTSPKSDARNALGVATTRSVAPARPKMPARSGRKEVRSTSNTAGGRAKRRTTAGERRTRSASPARPASEPQRSVTASRKGAARRGAKKRPSAPKKKGRPQRPVHVPVISYRIKPLDPLQKCGAGTSVQSLYRVDETVDGSLRFHLVFNDRHGWYCEHGRNCPAVSHARKFDATARPGLN